MTTRSLPQTANARNSDRQTRALELVKSGETRPYTTTETTCTCPDYTHRHVACKHILALRVQTALETPVWAVAVPWTVGPLTCTYQGVPCKIVAAQMTESGDPNVTIETLDGLATLHGFSSLRHATGPYATATLTVARSILEAQDPASWEKIAASARSDRTALHLTPDPGSPDTKTPAPQQPGTSTPDTKKPDPFTVDGFEITRLDFFLQEDGSTVVVQKLAQTPTSRDRHVVLAEETKPVDLDAALAYCRKHGYTTRRWPAVRQNGDPHAPLLRPAGARAWKADEPWPIRTEGQIRKLRTQLGLLAHSLNLAFDL